MRKFIFLTAFLLSFGAFFDHAQAQSPVAPTFDAVKGASEAQPIDMTADRLEFDSDKNLLIGIGNVEVRHEGDFLTADYLEVYTDSQDVYAKGNVYILQGATEWEGEELRYNLKTKQGDFGPFKAFQDPYYITAEDAERVSEREIHLEGATLSTCEGPAPAFYIKAREAILYDGETLKSKSVTMHLAGVPFFYLPYFNKNLNENKWEFTPGYSSRQGGFLLTKYNYNISTNVDGVIRFDVRTKRGLGVGSDLIWDDEEDGRYQGELNLYYTDDNEPLQDDFDKANFGDLVDSDRYRVRLQHRQNLSPLDYVIADFNYVSDPLVLEDFFDDEYARNAQPENRVTYTHRDDLFTAGAEVSLRLNDFYENVNRMPELFLDVHRQKVYDTDFYYDGENSLGFYERVFPDSSTEEDYDAFRLDTRHEVFYPTRHFGWLNVTPRAGYRGTYYSETRSGSSVTNDIISADTNGVFSTNSVVSFMIEDGDAELRNLFSIGTEASFKAFKEIHDRPTIFGDGLRHVVEPFTDYTLVGKPNLTPDELPQFDEIDTLDEQNRLRFGVRNKLQTKDGKAIRDLLDLTIYTDYFLDPNDGEDDFSSLFYDANVDLYRWLGFEFDGSYSYENSELEEINSIMRFSADDRSSVALEHRYRIDSRDLLAISTDIFPLDVWSFGAYWRYNNDESELEEQQYTVRHKGGCLSWGFGVRERDDDITLWVQLWLTALPQTSVDLGR